MDVVVDHRREQVVRERDRGEVAGEVEVDVLHRHDLRIAAARRAALHAEHRAERRLAQADDRLLADAVQRVAEADRHRRLAFARRGGGDGGDQDQLAVLLALEVRAVVERDLGLVVAERREMLLRDAEPLLRERDDRLHLGLLGDLDVAEASLRRRHGSWVSGLKKRVRRMPVGGSDCHIFEACGAGFDG